MRFTPLTPNEPVALKAHFDAAYPHGDRLDAALTYITLDDPGRRICATQDDPSATFVPCRPVFAIAAAPGVSLHLPADELTRDRRSVRELVSFRIRHPSFDVDEARARAGIAFGPYGYEIASRRWILVDEARGRTYGIGEMGATEDLPGNWLDLLMALNSSQQANISWSTHAVPMPDEVRAVLSSAGLSVRTFAHKDYTSPTNVVLAVEQAHVPVLARTLNDLGAALQGFRVVK